MKKWIFVTLLVQSLVVLASPPTMPEGLTVSKAGYSATLSWIPNPQSDLTYYSVYRADESGGPYTEIAQTTDLEYTDLYLSPGTWYYVISAHNPYGESPLSEEVEISFRTPLHRYYNATITDHFYTTDFSELGAGNASWVYEGVACYVEPDQTVGSVQFDRYWNGVTQSHYYTIDATFNEPGWQNEGYVGFAYPYQISYSVPLYHYHNSTDADHFYTTDWNALGSGNATWTYFGVAAYVFTTP